MTHTIEVLKAAPTPGPWSAGWSKYREDTFVVTAGHPSNRVLAQFDGDGDGPDEQSLADARLIAAAPELLKALKYARRFLCVTDHDVAYVDGVIAQATGAA